MKTRSILLAEDDDDDYLIFREVITEYYPHIKITRVKDGVELIRLLKAKPENAYDILFLDINMPKKNGFQCIDEIKLDLKLSIPVIVFSTSNDYESIRSMYYRKAAMYICKPNNFQQHKDFLIKAISVNWKTTSRVPASEFVLADVSSYIEGHENLS